MELLYQSININKVCFSRILRCTHTQIVDASNIFHVILGWLPVQTVLRGCHFTKWRVTSCTGIISSVWQQCRGFKLCPRQSLIQYLENLWVTSADYPYHSLFGTGGFKCYEEPTYPSTLLRHPVVYAPVEEWSHGSMHLIFQIGGGFYDITT